MSPRKRRGPDRRSEDSFELSTEAKDSMSDIWATWGVRPENRMMYDPLPQQRLPELGAWVMIIRPLPGIEGNIDEHITVGRFFYAMRGSDIDGHGFAQNGTYKASLITPWGSVCLWPHEYSMVDTTEIVSMWQAKELIFNPTNMTPAMLNEQVFYARSRGIDLSTAAALSLGTIEGNIGWFEPAPELVPIIEEYSDRSRHFGHLSAVNHERRAAAKARAGKIKVPKKVMKKKRKKS